MRGAPPHVPRNPVTKSTIVPNADDSSDENKNDTAKDNQSETIQNSQSHIMRGPPPPVPRPTVIRPKGPPLSGPPRLPPPVPGRPKDQVTDVNADSKIGSDIGSSVKTTPPRPSVAPPLSGAPPPLPRTPSARQRPLPPSSSPSVSKQNEIQNEDNPNTIENEGLNVDNNQDFYAVIERPKRPTIIRPKKKESDSSEENKQKITPDLPPRLYENDDNENINTNSNADKKESMSKDCPDGQNEVPEFLRKKLKSTTVENTSNSDTASLSAGSKPEISTNPRPLSSGAPPPPLKPKPSVLPKPQVAAKPAISAKPVAITTANQNTSNSLNEIHVSTNRETNLNSTHKTNENTDVSKPTMVKRPTIIRPSKGGNFGSVENVSLNNKSNETSHSVDDSAINSVVKRSQPPLPNKRPVSMVDIHKAVENEEKHFNNSHNNITSSVEDINNGELRPKPSPRPVVRTRPTSMMVPPVSRPPQPTTLPNKSENSSPPLRPQIRAPNKTTDSDGNKPPARPHAPIGVAVLPNMGGDFGPPKPARRPPPPSKSSPKQQQDSSSDDDDEFVTAQEKPDRPAAGPSRQSPSLTKKQSPGSVRRNSDEEETKRPPRPGAPPPPRKSSINDSPQEETDIRRPTRPDSKPIRPTSTPVKQSPPQKPTAAPTPRVPATKQKGLPSLPKRPGPGHPLYYHMMQVPHGIATHDFTGETGDDISFKAGEVIVLVRSIDADWMVGKIGEKEGMFPRNFIKIKMPLPGETLDDDISSEDSTEFFVDAISERPDTIGHGPRCRARFDFDGEGPDDLIFEEGDVIKLIERVGLEWRKGEISGRTGLFPLSFVEVIEDLPELEEEDSGNMVKALFDFDGEYGDLTFQAGERIKVTHSVNEEWLYGEIGDRKGQFPIQFIDHIPHGLPPLHKTTNVMEDNSVETNPVAMRDYELVSTSSKLVESTVQPYGDFDTSRSETSYCIALFDFPGPTDEDLTFNEGDRIEIVERIGDEWLKGRLHGHVGMFPAAFVEIKVDVTDSLSTPVNTSVVEQENYGVALYDFAGEADYELTFNTGDRFVVQGPVVGAEDWSWGIINGHRGMFPAAFVGLSS
ncbi:hypothetical protein ACF0H5_010231 [Mactra antiquata]